MNRPTVKRLLIKAFNNSKLDDADITKAYKYLKNFLKTHPENEEVKNPLEKMAALAGIFLMAFSLFFLSFNLTGNVVSMTPKTSNFLGVLLFIVGLGIILFYFKKR